MTTQLPPPPPVDYTSRDFASIRDDLINLIPSFMPDWTSRDPNDFGIALLELWAYIGDQLNYYADRSVNEAFLDTATQRSSVVRIAKMLGYSPTSVLAASTTLTFTNSTASAITVPAGSQVATSLNSVSDAPVTFETASAVTVPANSSATVTANEGQTVSGEQVGISDGTLNQTFSLFNPSVIDGSVMVTVSDGVSSTDWTALPRLVDAEPSDQVFTVSVDDQGITSITFGDGVNGMIPPNNATIMAMYRVGGGVVGNVAPNTLTKIVSSLPAGLTVTNQNAASGGADAESIDSIRTNAPKVVNTLQRAVTLDDFANVSVGVPGVARAAAASTVPNNVTVWVAPQGGGGVDSSGNPLAALTTLISNVQSTLNDAKPAPTSVTVLGPTYVPINVTVNVNVANNYRQDRVVASVGSALNAMLAFDNVIFGDTVTLSDVNLAVVSVPGAIWGSVTVLDRGNGTGMNNALSLAQNEIPVVGTITVTGTGGIS